MAYTQEQYQAAGEWLAANLDNPGLVASTIQQLGLSQSDVLAAAQTINPALTTTDVSGYFGAANLNPFSTGAGALSQVTSDTTGSGALSQAAGDTTLSGSGTVTGGTATVTGGAGNDATTLTSGTVSSTTNATDAPQMTDYRGETYDVAEVTNLANELRVSTDASNLSGGVFKEKGASVGFNYDELSRVLGRPPTAYEQVLFDSARQLIDQGITSLNQLSIQKTMGDAAVRDEIDEFTGQATGNKIVTYIDIGTGNTVSRVLTPEEAARIQTETIVGSGGEGGETTYTRSYLDDFAITGRTLVGPDGRIISSQSISEHYDTGAPTLSGPLSLFAGETFAGKGSTIYQIVYDELGKPKFSTSAEQGAFRDLVDGVAFVGQFIPGFQPFAMAINALKAAEQGNVIGALASLAGAGAQFTGSEFLSNASTGLRVAEAIDRGDVGSLISALASNPTINSMAGSTMLTDTISLADVGKGVQLVTGLQTGNVGTILTAAGGLLNNSDFKIAGAAANIIQELSKDNPNFSAIAASIGAISGKTDSAARSVDAGTVTKLSSNVVNNTASDITTAANTTDLATATYVGLMNAGATSTEAYDLAQVIAGTTGGTTNTADGIIKVDTTAGAGGTTDASGVITTGVADANKITGTDLGTLDTTTVTGAAGADAAGGKVATTDEVRRQSVLQDIQNASSFNDAFRTAREQLGPGEKFTWRNPKTGVVGEFVASTFAERPDLAGTSVVPGATSTTAGGGRGLYTGYDAAAAAAAYNTDLQIRAAEATEAATSTSLWQRGVDWLQNTMKMSSAAANEYLRNNPDSPFTQSVSTALEAAGELQKNVAGGAALLLDNKPLADTLIKGGEQLIKSGQAIGTGPQDTQNWQATQSLVSAADGVWEKLGVIAGRVLDGTSGLSRQVEMELRQELPALFLGGGTAKGVLIASGLVDTADTAGNAAIDAYDDAVKAGKSHTDALSDARKAGGAAGAAEAVVQATIGKLADLGVGKLDNIITKGVTRTTGEGLTEGLQEAASTGASALATGKAVTAGDLATAGVLGSVVGKGTATATSGVNAATDTGSATLTGGTTGATTGATVGPVDTSNVAAVDTSNVILANGGNAGNAATAGVDSAMSGGADAADAVDNTVTSVVSNGGDVNTTVNSAVNAATLNGADATVAADAAATAANNSGANVTVDASTNVNGTVASTTIVNTDNNTNTTSTVDTNTNTQTTVTTNNNSNITVDTNVDNNTGTSTVVVTDANTGGTTTITTNSDTDDVDVVDSSDGEVIDTTTTVIDSTTIDLGDGRVIDTTTGEVLDPEEVDRRKTNASSKAPPIPRRRSPLAGAPAGQTPTYPYKPSGIEETWLGGRFLDIAPFAALFGLLPEDTPLGQEAKIFSALQRASGYKGDDDRARDREAGFYAYGSEPKAEEVLAPFMGGGSVQGRNTGGKIMASPLMAARGGDVPHKGSHYVQGAGGGQDDLIPARLADGEYVFDAEIVAALGDGSNKEGARRLDAMRESIRKHKRSGSLKKIPPPAKSPLQYLKEASK